MDDIKSAIHYYLSDGKEHTVEEVKAEISRLIGGGVMSGEVDSIFGELLWDTVSSRIIEGPNGYTTSWLRLK